MIYRLKELKGDTIAVPQLVFSKLGIAEEYNVRVALYVLATGVTDPTRSAPTSSCAAASVQKVRWLSGQVQGFWSATRKTPRRAQSPVLPPPCAGRRSPPPAALTP